MYIRAKSLIIIFTIALISCGKSEVNNSDENTQNTEAEAEAENTETENTLDQNENSDQAIGFSIIAPTDRDTTNDLSEWYNIYWEDFRDSNNTNSAAYLERAVEFSDEYRLLENTLLQYASETYNTIANGNPASTDADSNRIATEFYEQLKNTCNPIFEGGLLVQYNCGSPSKLIYEVPNGGKLLIRFRGKDEGGFSNIFVGNNLGLDPEYGYGVEYGLSVRDNNQFPSISLSTLVGVRYAFQNNRLLNTIYPSDPNDEYLLRSAVKMMRGLRTGQY